MKYISKLTALLLAVMLGLSSASALTIDDLTRGTMDALYQAVSEEQYRYCDAGVLGDWIELDAFQNVADKKYYTFQWYDQDGNMLDAADDPCKLRVRNTMTEQQFYCIATDATDNQLKSDIFVIPAAQTTDMEAYLSYLYGDEFYGADGNRDLVLTYTQVMDTWNVPLEDGSNLGENVVAAWWAERSLDIFDPELFCSCVVSGKVTADGCVLHPDAVHDVECEWYMEVTVVTDEATGITVTGDIPESVTLQVSAATGPMPEIDTRHFNALRNYPIISGYNITLLDEGGSEYEVPEGTTVWVKIPNAWLSDMEYPVVDVYHVKDSGEVVYMTSQRDEVVLCDDHSVYFETDGFSDYTIVSGGQYTGYFDNGAVVSFDMVPGSSATAGRYNHDIQECKSSNPDVVSVEYKDGLFVFTAASNAPVGAMTTVTLTFGHSGWKATATVNITIISEQEKEDINYKDKFVNQAYPVQIAIRNDGVLPSEPSIYDSSSYTYFKSDLTVGSPSDYYRTTAEGTIDSDILNHERFYYVSAKGEPVIGMYDATGDACKQFLSGIDWDKILEEILKQNGINYSYRDGEGVLHSEPAKAADKDQYVVIPYVVKCQEDDGKGWHIDCAVALKNAVTLFYDFNLPDGITIKDPSSNTKIGLPNNERGVPPAKFTVGQIDNMTFAADGSKYIKAAPDYQLTFQGWNTAPDGSGTMYQPSSDIRISEDTTLYAIWSITPELGTGNLKVRKVVQNSEEQAGGIFTFTISIPGADSDGYDYTLYGADNVAVKNPADDKPVTGTVTDGSTFSLTDGQYIIIKSLPISKNGSVVTVTETAAGEYTPSWSGGTANGASVTVSIMDGRISELICTNAKASATSSLTIKKQGMSNGESAIVKVTANGQEYMIVFNSQNTEAVIANLPIGSAYEVEEVTNWSWLYTTGVPVYTTASKEIVADASKNLVTIANTRKDDKWLHDESVVENDFSDGSQEPLNNQ